MKESITKNDCHNFSRITLKVDVMKKLVNRSFTAITTLSLGLGLMLAGCGGGGSQGVSSEVVSGTAAVGAPLSGQVSLKDSSTPPQQRSTIIGVGGSFSIDVTSMKAPYVLQAKGRANEIDYKLHSFSEGTGIANINPLSDLIVANAAGDDDPADVFEKSNSDKNQRIKNNYKNTIAILMSQLKPLLKNYNAENSNPITSPFVVNHPGLDELLDNVKITVSKGLLSIVNVKSGAIIFSGRISDIAHGIFDDGALPPIASAPTAPTGLTAVEGTGQVTLKWTSVSNATSYNLYYSTTTGVTKTNGTKITSVTSPTVHTGRADGTTYYYIVTAVNSAGEGAASAQASAATNAAPAPAACGSCHAIPPSTGAHVFHVSSLGYGCDKCHGTGYSSTTVNAATHQNGVKDVGGNSGWNATTRSCSNSCHGSRSW